MLPAESTAAARAALAVGIDATALQVFVLGSYFSTVFTLAAPTSPPMAYMFGLLVITLAEPICVVPSNNFTVELISEVPTIFGVGLFVKSEEFVIDGLRGG